MERPKHNRRGLALPGYREPIEVFLTMPTISRPARASSPRRGGKDDTLLSLQEAAAFLKVGRSSLFGLLSKGLVPYVRPVPGKRCVWRSALVAYLADREVTA
jgi:hypothetical protein